MTTKINITNKISYHLKKNNFFSLTIVIKNIIATKNVKIFINKDLVIKDNGSIDIRKIFVTSIFFTPLKKF